MSSAAGTLHRAGRFFLWPGRCLYGGTSSRACRSVANEVPMFGFVGRVSSANQMKEALDVSTQRTRAIAARVAQASLKNGDGFALPGQLGQPESTPTGQVDIESEMVALADE